MDKLHYKDAAGVMPALPVVAPVEFDGTTASALFTISTAAQDRDGDIVVPKGCLDRIHTYKANPIVLFDHGAFPLPIGVSEDPQTKTCTVNVQEDRITARVFFHCETLESSQVCRLVDKQVLRGASIGYKGISGKSINPQRKSAGTIFEEWELVEWSVVPVPANQEALRMALSAKWDGKKLSEPIATRFKSLLTPSTKLILPATVKSKVKRKKAMADDTKPNDAGTTVADQADDNDNAVSMPQSAEVAKKALEAHKALMDGVAEGTKSLEHPQMAKAFKSYLGKCMKAYGHLAKAAHDNHPDHFEEYKDEEGQEGDEGEVETEEVGSEVKDDNEGTMQDDDVSNVDKSLKLRQQKSWAKECQGHIATLKDAGELLEDMSKSANIPSGYKRQCKGVLPGLNSTASWITGKSAEDLETKAEDEQGNGNADEEAETHEAHEANAEAEAEVLKMLHALQTKAKANAAAVNALKGKK